MSPTCTAFLPSPNPRTTTCTRCGRPEPHHAPVRQEPTPPEPGRQRDKGLEQHLVDVAARSAGFFDTQGKGDDAGLWHFADARAWPGPVRADLDPFREVCEELADAVNYAVWGIEPIYGEVLRGEPEALDRYSMLLQGLAHVISAWHAFRTVPQ